MRKFGYNERKIRVLTLLRDHSEGMSPQAVAWQIGKLPARSNYSYMAKLWRWGLLSRRENPIRYFLSARGRRRLDWLRRRDVD